VANQLLPEQWWRALHTPTNGKVQLGSRRLLNPGRREGGVPELFCCPGVF